VVEDAVHPGTSNATLWLDTIQQNPVRCCFETLPGTWDTSHASGKGMPPGPEQPLNPWSGRHIPYMMEGRHVFGPEERSFRE
jgi:hypothetical protein